MKNFRMAGGSFKASRILKQGTANGKAAHLLEEAALKKSKPFIDAAWHNARHDLSTAFGLLKPDLMKPGNTTNRTLFVDALKDAWALSHKDLEKGFRAGLPYWNGLTLHRTGEAARILNKVSPAKLGVAALAAGGAGLAYARWGGNAPMFNMGYPDYIPSSQWAPFYPAPGSPGYPGGNTPGNIPGGYPGSYPGTTTNSFPMSTLPASGNDPYNTDGMFRLNSLPGNLLT